MPFSHMIYYGWQTKIGSIISEKHEEWFDQLTTFNLNARCDNYKQDFYKLCNKDYSEIWFDRIKTLEEWLKNQL